MPLKLRFSLMFTTPAMASEPYVADEPPVEDLDTLDQRGGNRVQVHDAVHVRGRHARAVHEDQRAYRAQAAKVDVRLSAVRRVVRRGGDRRNQLRQLVEHGFDLRLAGQFERVLAYRDDGAGRLIVLSNDAGTNDGDFFHCRCWCCRVLREYR